MYFRLLNATFSGLIANKLCNCKIATSKSELLNSYGKFHPSGPNFLRSWINAWMKPKLNMSLFQWDPLKNMNGCYY